MQKSCDSQEPPQLSNQNKSTSVGKAVGIGGADVAPIKEQPFVNTFNKLSREVNKWDSSTNKNVVDTVHNIHSPNNTPIHLSL